MSGGGGIFTAGLTYVTRIIRFVFDIHIKTLRQFLVPPDDKMTEGELPADER